MKKVGDLMSEMGFNKKAPDSVKEAFIRHLIKASTGVDVAPRKTGHTENKQSENKFKNEEQLAFDFQQETEDSSKKAV